MNWLENQIRLDEKQDAWDAGVSDAKNHIPLRSYSPDNTIQRAYRDGYHAVIDDATEVVLR